MPLNEEYHQFSSFVYCFKWCLLKELYEQNQAFKIWLKWEMNAAQKKKNSILKNLTSLYMLDIDSVCLSVLGNENVFQIIASKKYKILHKKVMQNCENYKPMHYVKYIQIFIQYLYVNWIKGHFCKMVNLLNFTLMRLDFMTVLCKLSIIE